MSQKIEYYIWHSNKLWLYDFSENAYVLYDKTEDIIQQFEYPLLWCGHDYKWHKLFTWGSQTFKINLC